MSPTCGWSASTTTTTTTTCNKDASSQRDCHKRQTRMTARPKRWRKESPLRPINASNQLQINEQVRWPGKEEPNELNEPDGPHQDDQRQSKTINNRLVCWCQRHHSTCCHITDRHVRQSHLASRQQANLIYNRQQEQTCPSQDKQQVINHQIEAHRWQSNGANLIALPSKRSTGSSSRDSDCTYKAATCRTTNWRPQRLLISLALVCLLSVSHNDLLLGPTTVCNAYQLTNNLIANNLPPKFITSNSFGSSAAATNSEIVVRVKEGPQSIGKLIYTLKGEDLDEDQLTFGVLGSMASELLRIENVPGNQANVYLKRELDRETTESHQVVITLTDGKLGRGNWITKSMLIIVEDVNDNYPVFGPHRTAISLREDTKAPLVIETIEATDADEGRFGQVIYKLDESTTLHEDSQQQQQQQAGQQPPVASMFAIDTIDGKAVISLIGQLDYEQRPLYQLRVLAVDRAAEAERLSASTSIMVSVEDCEDQPPMFTFAPSITRIPEDLPVGSPVVRVAAIDGDRGVNNPIKYLLVSVNNQDSGQERNLFSINSDSGQVSVARELDRELENHHHTSSWSLMSSLTGSKQSGSQPGAYVLLVRASEVQSNGDVDQASSSSVTTELTVILTDVNDEPPQFSQPKYFGELLENSPAESLVSFISAPPGSNTNEQQQQPVVRVFDRDQGTNGTFTLHLEGEHAHLFDIWPREATNEANLMLKVSPGAYTQAQNAKYLDFERTKELHLTLVAREKYPSLSLKPTTVPSRAHMTIYLKDANDNYPQFDSELYRVEIPENAQRGMHICAVKATDLDSGSFGSQGVRYTEIRGERANKFKLDPLSGVVTLKTNEHGFDRETIGQHHLIVEASDSNGQGNRNTTQLLIVLTDVNDQRPKFLLHQYEAFIYENELDFQNPLQVQAIDNDAPNSLNSRVTYSIVSGDPQQNFTIDPQSGRIRVRNSLVLSAPSDLKHQGDLLSDQNNNLDQHQTGGGLDFERIAQKRDDTRQFNLTIRATDSGVPEQLFDTTNVIILVYDKNDHAPVFTRQVYSKSIKEDAKEGSQVLQVLALDGDHSPINSKISYRISSGGSDKFVIDSETGLISVAHGANLDIDQQQASGAGQGSRRTTNYLLNVLAFDGSFGPNQKSSSCLVNITILDVNNKAPEFVSLGAVAASTRQTTGGLLTTTQSPSVTPQHQFLSSSVYVNEDAPYGLIVTRLVATDLDSSAELRYSINYARSEARNEDMALVEPALYRDCFSIDQTDGTIKVAKQLDRELFDQVKLRLQVEDIAAQTPDQVAYTYLMVRITDVNDNRPTFKRPIYKAVVNENSISGTSVISIAADDKDLNKTLRYSLEANSPELMRLVRINPKSGEVTVNDKIDRELFPLINVTVKAEDFGHPHPLQGSAQLLITVRDENDNNPIFLNSSSHQHHLRAATPTDLADPKNHNMNEAGQSSTSSYRLRSLGPAQSRSYNHHVALPDTSLDETLAGNNHHPMVSDELLLVQANRGLSLLSPGATAKVREDAQVGHQIAYVKAEDADLGNNGRVTYLLDGASSGGKFRIDRDSGVISVAQQLDRESQKQYTLIIEACDNYDLGYSTGESRRAFTQVNIQITDINDNVPIITTNLQPVAQKSKSPDGAQSAAAAANNPIVSSSAAAYPTYDEAMSSPGPYEMAMAECLFINEFQPLNEPILTIIANDADDPDTPNGQMDLAIINNLPQNELFGLVPIQSSRSSNTGDQTTTTSSTPPTGSNAADLSGFGDLLLDESRPTPDHIASHQSRSRHNKRSAEALESSLLEPLASSTGNFYSPAHSTMLRGAFSVAGGARQPQQPTLASLSRQGNNQRTMQNPGYVPISSSSLEDPESSSFTITTTSTTTEAPLPGSSVTLPSNNVPGDGHQQLQTVLSGQQQAHVVLTQSLKERVGNYTILVRATDRGQPALSSVKLINICVQDVNNHAPIFVRPPNLNNNTIRIMENATIGSFVTQVEAQDADHGLNGELQYYLKPTNIQNGNNDWQSFKIDRLTGVISTVKQFNRQLKKYYTLRVQAQDFGRPTSLSSDIDINIMIVNAGKYQPEFEVQQQSLQFTENLAPGVEWFTLIQTTNLDDDPALINANNLQQVDANQPTASSSPTSNNWLASPCYYIVDGDDSEQIFHLDRYTHRLTNQKLIDREKRANFTLLVQASNNCNKPPNYISHLHSAAAQQVGDSSTAISEYSSAMGDKKTDTGSSRKARDANNNFATVKTSDLLQQPPQTTFNSLLLDSILASDKSLLKVSIKVKDVNDNAPKFTQKVYTGGITTEADFGTVFMIVQATDGDADAYGQITYSILKPIKRNLSIGGSALDTKQASVPSKQTAPTTLKPRLKRSSSQSQTTTFASLVQFPAITTTTKPHQIQFPYSSNANNENIYSNENDVMLSSSPSVDDTTGGGVGGNNGDSDDDLFVINGQNGEISLNFDPQKHMKGYFEFEILAKDTEGLQDTAKVFIYLLRQDQRVKFVIRLTPQELRQRLNKFRSVFGNITGAIVNIDSYKYFENHDGTVDKKKTSLFLHFVNPEDNTIIDVDKVLTLIDNNIEYLDELYKEFHVLSSEAAHLPLSGSGALVDPIDQVRTGLMGVSLFLALILILVIALYLNQRTRYERQLKAATVSAFGSSPLHIDPDFHSQTNLPNTNLHSQDPNPIWVNGYGGEQVDWMGATGPGGDNVGANGGVAAKRPGSRGNHRQSGKLHSASSGVGMAIEDDAMEDGLSSSSGGQSVDMSSLNGGQLHYNGATTATPRDSLNSSHGQAPSSSGSNSASTTNERQALCGPNASSTVNRAGLQAPQVLVNQQQQRQKKSNRPKDATATSGGSSTFGAMKEVTIYTDQQQHQVSNATYAQPMKLTSNKKSGQNLIQTITTNAQQQQQHQITSHNVNKLASQFNYNQNNASKQQQIYVAGNKEAGLQACNKQVAPNKQHQSQQQQRILVHANGADVNQGIIKTGHHHHHHHHHQQQQQQQQKTNTGNNNLNAKFVPANYHNNINMTNNQHQQEHSSVQQNFETSLSKLSILNLETTEL